METWCQFMNCIIISLKNQKPWRMIITLEKSFRFLSCSNDSNAIAIKTSLKDHRRIKIVSRNLKNGHVNCSRFRALFPYIYL